MGTELRAKLTLKIGGSAPNDDFMNGLVEVVVDTNLFMPDMFTIEVHDDDLEFVDANTIDLGKPVEITIEAPEHESGTGTAAPLIKMGEITSIEPHFAESHRATLLIRGYDKSHRLHRGRKTRTFTKAKDSDIIGKIAKEAGLKVDADVTSVQHDYVLQNNQTNMEFLLDRARRNGYQAFVDAGKLYFKKADFKLPGDGPEVEWGTQLLNFRPRMSGVHQADTGVVMSWDSKAKKAITAKASAPAAKYQGGITKTGGAASKSAFKGKAEAVVVERPMNKVDDAKALATAVITEINREFVQAEGECFGDPRIRAGKTITISGVGDRFSGEYLVTASTHIYRAGRYRTTFLTGGHEPYTVSQLVTDGHRANGHSGDVGGVAIGLVTNLKDPDKLGRVKVTYPWLGKGIESDWVRVAGPMAGKSRGICFLPEVNDEVVVAFEHGDPHRPYVIGSLWNQKDSLPGVVKDGKVLERTIKTTSGHVITLSDESGKERIVIKDKNKNNQIIIDSSKNNIIIVADKDIRMVGKGNLLIEAMGDLTLSGKNVVMKAKMAATIKANQKISLDTSQLEAVGKATVTVKASVAAIKLAGPQVNINNGALEVM